MRQNTEINFNELTDYLNAFIVPYLEYYKVKEYLNVRISQQWNILNSFTRSLLTLKSVAMKDTSDNQLTLS